MVGRERRSDQRGVTAPTPRPLRSSRSRAARAVHADGDTAAVDGDTSAMALAEMLQQAATAPDTGRVIGLITAWARAHEEQLVRAAAAREEQLVRAAAARAAELAAVIEQLPSGVLVVDTEGRSLISNQAADHLRGGALDPSRPAGEQVVGDYAARDVHTGRPLLPGETASGRALSGETVHNLEYLFRRPGETEDRWMRSSSRPLRDAAGHITGAAVVFADVTDERRLMRELAASAERSRTLYAAMACGVVVLNAAGEISDANEAALEVLGRSLEEVRGRSIAASIEHAIGEDGAELPPTERPGLHTLRTGQQRRAAVIGITRLDGQFRWLQVDAAPVRGPDGQVLQVVLSCIDLTARKQAEADREQTLSLLQATLESTADGILVVDTAGNITAYNQKFVQMWGIPDDIMALRDSPQTLAFVRDQLQEPAAFLARARELYAHPDAESSDILEFKDGRVFERYSQPQRLGGVGVGRVWSFRDVTERKRFEEQLTHQALHDALTDLPNRTLLHDRLEQALRVSARERTPLALFVMDLDRFKEVNDTLGHDAGDTLLREVAARLHGAARASDTVARLGGDEFAVLLPATDAAGSAYVAQVLRSALATPFTLEGQPLTLVASIGIALAPDHGTDAATLLRRADVAMYVAKRAGSGYSVYDVTHDQHSPARLTLEADLRQALAEDGLLLHYQPLVDVRSGRTDRVEALARWPHFVHGPVPPDQFIPLAEHTGLIVPLTEWVLETALRQCRAWQRSGLTLGVAVNLSMRALHAPQLPETIAWLLRRYAIDPARLTLEITESALMVDPPRARAVLRRLSDLGLHLAIDDFGTGYSSLGYLKQLPVDEVKIDRSFVQGMGQTMTKDSAIVRSIVELGHNLGLTVVAEGVEDHATWERLRGAHCDVAQGYHLGRPMPAPELERRLSVSRGSPGATLDRTDTAS